MRVKSLKAEVVRFQGAYQALETASAKRTEEIAKLTAYIEQLTNEIKSLKSSRGRSIEEQAAPEDYEGFSMVLDPKELLQTWEHYFFEEFLLSEN